MLEMRTFIVYLFVNEVYLIVCFVCCRGVDILGGGRERSHRVAARGRQVSSESSSLRQDVS